MNKAAVDLAISVFCWSSVVFLVAGGKDTAAGDGDSADAEVTTHPWQLSLRVGNSHSCGASLISATKAVTAAHCGGGALVTYTVLAGSSDPSVSSCATCVIRPLSVLARHCNGVESCLDPGYVNDLAVLRFDRITRNSRIAYVPLPPAGNPHYSGHTCFIVGWERTNSTEPLAEVLHQDAMVVVTNEECGSYTVRTPTQIHAGHVCSASRYVTACSGVRECMRQTKLLGYIKSFYDRRCLPGALTPDLVIEGRGFFAHTEIGGPLICDGVLVGVTSFSRLLMCNPFLPTLHTRIGFFMDWIDTI